VSPAKTVELIARHLGGGGAEADEASRVARIETSVLYAACWWNSLHLQVDSIAERLTQFIIIVLLSRIGALDTSAGLLARCGLLLPMFRLSVCCTQL